MLKASDHSIQRGREHYEDESPLRLWLFHRRLSVLDLSESGWQPMSYADGRYSIVFNGEIYNYLELRSELQALGHIFRTECDTEVLVAAYAEWGAKSLERLTGMFAFCVVDHHLGRLFLARDPFGIKPLYYTLQEDRLAFASEIAPLFELIPQARVGNPERLYTYLRYGITDYGNDTFFANIRQLPAGHYAQASFESPSDLHISRFWELKEEPLSGLSFDNAASHLRELFLKSIGLHLRSDVPVGAALSGGIDSSAVVSAIGVLFNDAKPIRAFSYVPQDTALSEWQWIDIVRRSGNVAVTTVTPSPDELANDLERLILAQGEPFASTSIYAQYRVFQAARDAGVKVMLDGQGADEMLGGYRHYYASRLSSLVRGMRGAAAARLIRGVHRERTANAFNVVMETSEYFVPMRARATLRTLTGRAFLPPWMNAPWFQEHSVPGAGLLRRASTRTLHDRLRGSLTDMGLPHLLRYEDRNSMAASIESRVPFLLPEMATFLLRLPEDYLISPDGVTKSVFREAMRGIVPAPILARRDKIGFATPERAWLVHLSDWVSHIIDEADAASLPMLNMPELKREWAAILEGTAGFRPHVWRWVNLISWSQQFRVQFAQ